MRIILDFFLAVYLVRCHLELSKDKLAYLVSVSAPGL